jgi:hypothetical protein
MPDPVTQPGKIFPKSTGSFAGIHPQAENLPEVSEESDLAYRQRLLEVYESLKAADALVAPLPEWVTRPLKDEDLKDHPRLQAALAACTAYTPSKWLLEKELSQRDSSAPEPGLPKSWPQHAGEDVYDAADREELSGLCFSGGGIRSATFCLGVLQALAGAKKLCKFDYLSTVSGGGYIHEWLASWIARDPGRIQRVQDRLTPIPEHGSPARWPNQILWLRRYSSYLTPRQGILSADTWTMIAIWFRNTFLNQIVLFSFLACCVLGMRVLTYCFLPPQPDGASAPALIDSASWPNGSLYAVLLGLLILLGGVFGSVLPMGRALRSVTQEDKKHALGDKCVLLSIVLPSCLLAILAALEAAGRFSIQTYFHLPLLLTSLLVYVVAILFAMTLGGEAPETFDRLVDEDNAQRSQQSGSKTPQASEDDSLSGKAKLFAILMCVVAVACAAAAYAPAIYLNYSSDLPSHSSAAERIHEAASGIVNYFEDAAYKTPPSVSVQQAVTAAGESVSRLSMQVTVDKGKRAAADSCDAYRLMAVLLPALFLFMQFLAIRLQLGMIGRFYTESRREWLGRLGGWSAIFACVWMLLSAVALFGPWVVRWFCQPAMLRWAWGGLSMLAVHAVTLYAGGSSKSDGKPKQGALLGYGPLDLVGIAGAPLCILSLLLLVSGLVDQAQKWAIWQPYPLFFSLLGAAAIFFLFGWRIDVNFFSMHGFYRDRLSRCYLGATNSSRFPDPFTHFDEHESGSHKDILVSELLPGSFGGTKFRDGKPYNGPFPIFCSTVNLTFGEELGCQERKGASFAFTPLYSGYHVGWTAEKSSKDGTSFNGFVPTRTYAYSSGGISVSTAVAISGAALNPNMGYNSSPPLAFLMTLFNVRLGWWLANPRKPKVWPAAENKPTPQFGIFWLLRELFGQVEENSNYVCLSDGGHFENMGLYELVRRRCKYIVICDAEQDSNTVFQGIGDAIAKCRTDFGAEIDLDLRSLISDPITKHSAEHFRVGTIRYPAPPHAPSDKEFGRKYEGTVVYLKTTMVGDETADLLHHKRACPDFPQDSTLNQWFTESQFESYRRLGQLIGEKASDKISFRA